MAPSLRLLVVGAVLVAGCAGAAADPAEPALARPTDQVATAEPAPLPAEPSPSPTPQPTSSPKPEPKPSTAPEPTPNPPEATPSPTLEPTPTPAPVRAAAPPPTIVRTPAPTVPPAGNVPVAADEPAALAEQLVTSERAVRSPVITGEALAWHGHLQQLVYRKLVDRPELRDPVLAAVPDDLDTVARANLNAGAELRSLISRPRDTLPPWRIVEPARIDALIGYYQAAEAEFGVHWSYLAAIHLVETRMGRIRGTSTAGAQGPMQFIPSTWAAYGEGDINSDKDSIRAAARYLRASGAPSDMTKAIYAYNHSMKYVRAVMAYAEVIRADPSAYRGYHQWQVYYLTTRGDVLLPVGYASGS